MNSIFNDVSDLSQLGNSVIWGFEQQSRGELPPELFADLSTLTNTLAEGMTIEFNKLCQTDDSEPQEQASRELFMTTQRKYCDDIPGYAEKAGELYFEDY